MVSSGGLLTSTLSKFLSQVHFYQQSKVCFDSADITEVCFEFGQLMQLLNSRFGDSTRKVSVRGKRKSWQKLLEVGECDLWSLTLRRGQTRGGR